MIIRRFFRIVGHQRWIRYGIRDRMIRLFHNPDLCPSEPFSVDFYGKEYHGDFNCYLDWCVFYFGAYCVEELDLIQKTLSAEQNTVFLDIGANIGHHSLFASQFAKSVLSFEPYSVVFNIMEERIRHNNIDNVTLFKFGLGAANETLCFIQPAGCNTGAGRFDDSSCDGSFQLPVRVGDEVIESLALQSVHFIKIDVEGFEAFVLSGIARTLARFRPVIFIEWNSQVHPNSSLPELVPSDYNLFDFEPDKNFMVLFAKPGYRLNPFNGLKPGNKVLIPIEKLSFFGRPECFF